MSRKSLNDRIGHVMNCARTLPTYHGSLDQNPQGRGPRILVAIECPVEALAVESLLRGDNYNHVRVTTDVREIAPMFVRWPFHLLILDMHSELTNSVSVLQDLARPISASELSVLALTNPGAEQERLAALAAGATDTLTRPLSHENALPSIRRALMSGPAAVFSF